MLRLITAFVVLFAAAVALTTLLPTPKHGGLPVAASEAAVAHRDAQSEQADRNVRVVYPPSDGTASVSAPVAVAVAPQADAVSMTPVAAPVVPAVAAAAEPDAVSQAVARLDINTASAEALDNIAGAGRIGRTIVQHRPYRSVEDLLSKRVIRKSVYERIKDQVASQ